MDDIFTSIYNQQFSEAESMLNNQGNQIDSFYFDILSIDLYWWKQVCSQKKSDLQQFKVTLNRVGETQSTPEDNQIRQLVMFSYKLRYEFKRYNILGAIQLRSKIKKLLEEIDPEKLAYSKNRVRLFYLYNSLFDYFDNILNPLFLESKRITRNNALREIEMYTRENDLVVSTLANYFLGKIYFNIEKNPEKGRICFRELTARYPQNAIFAEFLENSQPDS
ncbi:hypothetical protein [Mariniphaga anaerophila]|uniref:hypothetical protein n=1 Tax=Mariniphaga anaerophila TaxID=1484053 RepID=UPI001C3191DD|nr:hypothetical protein [Mariniphaga anaerophila]